MSKTVRTVEATEPVRTALNSMIKHNIGSIVVTERSNVVGIITERDITRKIAEHTNYLDKSVGQVCSRPVISISPKTETWEAFEIMLRNKIRRLPVLEDKKLVGIVTERDLFKWVLRVVYEPNVPEHIKRLISQTS
jgi:CBS domain-containing protein